MEQSHRSGRSSTSVSLGVEHYEHRAHSDQRALRVAVAWSSRTSTPEPADTRARPNAVVTRRSLWTLSASLLPNTANFRTVAWPPH